MALKITLGDYAVIKNVKIDDIIKYALKKGLKIPQNSDYIMDDSILKLIDPVFYHQKKYAPHRQDTTPMSHNMVGMVDLDKINHSVRVRRDSKDETTNSENEQSKIDISEAEIKKLCAYCKTHLNQTLVGIVERITPQGAEITFDDISGFLYKEDISWKYVDDINNCISKGDRIEVMILGLDEKKYKVKLGKKQLFEDPLKKIASQMSVGQTILGIVRKIIEKKVAYIEVQNGVIAQANIHQGCHYSEGETVCGVIKTIDTEQHLLEIDLKTELNMVSTSEFQKKANRLKNNIGIVLFFDSYTNNFGKVITNSYGIDGKDKVNKLHVLNLTEKNWIPSITPDEGDWITMNPVTYKGKWIVTCGNKLTFDKKGLMLALPYRGRYARIKGVDLNNHRHDYNVICHVVDKILQDKSGTSIISEAFGEYLSSFQSHQLNFIIGEFLQDKELLKRLIMVLPSLQLFAMNGGKYTKEISLLVDCIESIVFSENRICYLEELPLDYNYGQHLEKIVEVLEESIKDEPVRVKKWIQSRHQVLSLFLSKDISLSIDLLYIIYQTTNDISVFCKTEKRWSDIYKWLQKRSEVTAEVFLDTYFNDKDSSFIEQSNLKDFFDRSILKKIFWKFIDNPSIHINVIKYLADIFVPSDFDIVYACLNNKIDISHLYDRIAVCINSMIKVNEREVRHFIELCINLDLSIMDIVNSSTDAIDNELYVELFAHTADIECLNAIDDFNTVPEWLNIQDAELIRLFLQSCQKIFVDDEDIEIIREIIGLISDTKFKDAISSLNENDQYKILQLCPEEYAKNIVLNYFSATNLFYLHMGEQWRKLKSTIPYVSFDLETDGSTIKEFAFKISESIRVYQGEEQLGALLRALKHTKIIVGHRIKQWDLGEVLSKKGYDSNAFVWDTLEIEILLNPCRYSYALRTGHTAQEDTELVDRLFWNQLYRLSIDEALCQELSDFLPPMIHDILKTLRDNAFADFFKKDSQVDSFYQELVDIDVRVISQLEKIGQNLSKTLIVAPKRLWPRIAEYMSLSFIMIPNEIEYLSISREKLELYPLDNTFLNTVLKRFLSLSKTPVVANIAQYLRLNYLSDTLLENYVVNTFEGTDCADLDVITNDNIIGNYDNICFVGCEIENKVNQYSLPELYSPSDFWSIDSSIPMRLGASSYIAISQEDRKLTIFDDVPTDAANVWIERNIYGKYIINYNYNYYEKLKSIATKASIETIPWTIANDDNHRIVLVHSEHNSKFDSIQKRVSATSRYRATYWVYQFALLKHIHTYKDTLPIILFLNDDIEITKVESYARYCGFYVPSEGSLIRKLELIGQRQNGMLVTTRDTFFDIVDWRKDNPYCYIWDQIAVEKHMMMWHGFTEQINRAFFNDEIDNEKDNNNECVGAIKDTYQSAILSIWSIYEYYYRFIKANSIESTMYILDSFMEEYHSLSSLWGVTSYAVNNIWDTEEEFRNSLAIARTFFTDKSLILNGASNNQEAMDIIFSTLVNPEKDPNKHWHDYQKEFLPLILSRKENYLVSLPTGGGKSILFQGPALYNSAYTNKLTIVVTPLKALMEDQVKELWNKGFITNVDYLNGDRSFQEVKSIYRKINGGEIAILYVTPERFRSKIFLNALVTRMANDNGLEYLVFDEAHCISQWGMEFRPEYLNVIKKCKELQATYGDDMCVTMFSATVTDMIYTQINEVISVRRLGQESDKRIYNPVRNHIGIEMKEVSHNISNRLNEIVEYIKLHSINPSKSRMLIFCKKRNQCEELSVMLADELLKHGILNKSTISSSVGYFHAGMDCDEREDIYIRFKNDHDPLYILCATKAFGMGMDIPNIHYIVHLMPPSVLEDYLQEVGRAGRNKQMYEEVGFSINNPIPTMCLYSKEDIKKSKEQLLLSMLSWMNLEEIRLSIINYILRIQTIEKTKDYPIVIPNTLWASNQFDHDFIKFKLGMYWLEIMGRFRIGYLSPTHINITILDNDGQQNALKSPYSNRTTPFQDRLDALSATAKGKNIPGIMEELRNIKSKQLSSSIQVAIQELSSKLCIQSSKLLDSLIWCEKNSFIRIEEETRCRIAFTRLKEVSYMLHHHCHQVAFYIILNATRCLLKNCLLRMEKSYSLHDIQMFIKENDSLNEIVKSVYKKNEENKQIVEKYMIWYNEDDTTTNKGLSIAKSYHNDLYKKRVRQVVALLEIIPDVKVKSFLDIEKKHIRQSVIVEKDTWKLFLDDFEKDCIKVLKYFNEKMNVNMRWSEVILQLKLEDKGFYYFDGLLHFLNGMAYLSTDSLLPTGIEIYTTEKSNDIILENIEDESNDSEVKRKFDEVTEIRNLRLYIMDVLTSQISNKQDLQELISSYFSINNEGDLINLLSKFYDDKQKFWEEIRATAFKNAERQLKDNPEQWAIYTENSNVNVNVEAGPGSGKTHLLTLKCAKLIYYQNVNPQNILVLAYNRAVVVELKSRLAKLFASLGLSRSASQLHVYTFHSLAKKICGETVLYGHELHEWENILLNTIKNNPNEIRARMPNIQYLFIDEFQDITQIRLNAIFELKNIYGQITFFTIGDKDQSIYGFEKKESMDPNFYYNQLYEALSPKKMTMNINYRSFPKILEAASKFLPKTSKVPISCKMNIDNEPQTEYVYINQNNIDWVKDFEDYVEKFKKEDISDLAVFFRTNNEVYHGYSLIKTLNIPGVRIRIQGASVCELFRMREIYAVLKYLDDNGYKKIKHENNESELALKRVISSWIMKMPNWDSFYLDVAFVLILDYLDYAATDEETHTYSDMADSIRETLREDNPQLYKLYDDNRFKYRRILNDQQINVILTTMHKVKGLEFDAVMIIPSVASLPFNPVEKSDYHLRSSSYIKEQMEEEKRLLYVAYTRAKKFLCVYKGERELALERMTNFISLEEQWGIREKQAGLDNYNIGYNANYNFKNNKSIVYNVKRNDSVCIRRHKGISRNGITFFTFNIEHKGIVIGQLSKKSTIARRMTDENIEFLSGYYVSDVFYWTYEDSLAADKRIETETGMNPNYAAGWSDEARKQGYIFIVNIAGYGKKTEEK